MELFLFVNLFELKLFVQFVRLPVLTRKRQFYITSLINGGSEEIFFKSGIVICKCTKGHSYFQKNIGIKNLKKKISIEHTRPTESIIMNSLEDYRVSNARNCAVLSERSFSFSVHHFCYH